MFRIVSTRIFRAQLTALKRAFNFRKCSTNQSYTNGRDRNLRIKWILSTNFETAAMIIRAIINFISSRNPERRSVSASIALSAVLICRVDPPKLYKNSLV